MKACQEVQAPCHVIVQCMHGMLRYCAVHAWHVKGLLGGANAMACHAHHPLMPTCAMFKYVLQLMLDLPMHHSMCCSMHCNMHICRHLQPTLRTTSQQSSQQPRQNNTSSACMSIVYAMAQSSMATKPQICRDAYPSLAACHMGQLSISISDTGDPMRVHGI